MSPTPLCLLLQPPACSAAPLLPPAACPPSAGAELLKTQVRASHSQFQTPPTTSQDTQRELPTLYHTTKPCGPALSNRNHISKVKSTLKLIVIMYFIWPNIFHIPSTWYRSPFKCLIAARGLVATIVDSTAPDDLVPWLLHRHTAMAHSIGRPDWVMRCPDTWSNIILGVHVF